MAGSIHDLANRLARALKESPENQAFQAATRRARADSKAEKLIKELRQKQLALQVAQANGQKPDAEVIKGLEEAVKRVQAHPPAREYLEAEAQLGQLWVEIQRLLGQAIGMEPAPGGGKKG